MNLTSKLSRAFFLAAALTLAASGQEKRPAQPPATLSELQARLSALVDQPRFAAALFGVKVVSLDTGKTLFEHDAQKYFSPASNSKLYTVAMVLDRLGPDYRIKTSLYAKARPTEAGVLQGDLVIYGRGDPTINARLNGGDILKALEPFAAALRKAGVKRIEGDLVGDESFLRGPPIGSGWDWDDLQWYYGAEISSLTINDNTLQLRIEPGATNDLPCRVTLTPDTSFLAISNRTRTVASGQKQNIRYYRPIGENVLYISGEAPLGEAIPTERVAFHNPALLFVTFLKEALGRAGISVGGGLRTVNWLEREIAPVDYGKWVELGFVESLPLRDIVREVQKPSQNLYTDLLLAHVGATSTPGDSASASQTSEEAGIRALNSFLNSAGIPKGDVLFEEGSGLSRNNIVTPNANVALLQFMARHRYGEVYRDALPVAGVDGTLRNRMKGTAAEGNVVAKTGTLRWANSLSGYVKTAAGERLVFAIMLNRYHNTITNRSSRADLDAIAVMLAEFTGCSDKSE